MVCNCAICHNTDCGNHGKRVVMDSDCGRGYLPVITNADKIRAMTDAQLAAMCAGHTGYQESAWSPVTYGGPDGGMYYTNKEAVDAWLKWLKQPAEEANDGTTD